MICGGFGFGRRKVGVGFPAVRGAWATVHLNTGYWGSCHARRMSCRRVVDLKIKNKK